VVEENEKVSEENLRCEYDQALEIAHHSDGIIHEVTAVVWGANTLLLELGCKVSASFSHSDSCTGGALHAT
jgi:hypothetical protein